MQSPHKRLFVLLCRAGGGISHIKMKIGRKLKKKGAILHSSIHSLSKSQEPNQLRVPSWSFWRAPLLSESPCRACSSGRPAGVPFASWRGRLCPLLGPCSGCCCRCEWSRRPFTWTSYYFTLPFANIRLLKTAEFPFTACSHGRVYKTCQGRCKEPATL